MLEITAFPQSCVSLLFTSGFCIAEINIPVALLSVCKNPFFPRACALKMYPQIPTGYRSVPETQQSRCIEQTFGNTVVLLSKWELFHLSLVFLEFYPLNQILEISLKEQKIFPLENVFCCLILRHKIIEFSVY